MLTAKVFIFQKIRWLAIALILLAMGAGSLLFTGTPGAVYGATLAVQTSNLTQGTAGTLYSENLTATGGSGNYTSWTLTGGSLPTGLTLAATGVVSGTPTKSGDFSFTAQVTDNTSATATGTVTLTINPGPIAKYAVSSVASAQAGTSFNVVIQAQDQYSNNITSGTDAAENVGVTFAQTDSQATVTGNTTSGGKATVSLTLTKLTAGQQLTFTGDTSGKSGTSNSFSVGPGPIAKYAVSTISSPQQAGTSFNVTIQAQDQYSNNVTSGTENINVTYAVADSQAAVTGATTSSGKATVSLTLKKATAGQQVTFTGASSGKSGSSNSFTVNPGPAASLSVSGYPTSVTAGTSHTFTVTARDAYGNTVTGYGGTVSFTSSDSQASLSGNSTLSSGTGTFSATLKTAGTQSITATDTVTSSITGTQSGIAVSAAASSSSQSTSGVTYGLPAPVTLPLNVNGSQSSLTLSTQMRSESPVNLNSQDNKVSLTIPTGTLVELNGHAPTSISLTPASSAPPLPQGQKFIGLSLDCQPDGLVFDPAIDMVWHVGALPANARPGNVRVAYYDHIGNVWVNVPATYDPATGDITAKITHFTSYAAYYLESQAPATTAPTATASATPTPTATMTATATAPATPTATAPATPTATASVTPTPTATMTPTATAPEPSAPAATTSTFNWGMLIGVVAGVVIILVILLWTTGRRRR